MSRFLIEKQNKYRTIHLELGLPPRNVLKRGYVNEQITIFQYSTLAPSIKSLFSVCLISQKTNGSASDAVRWFSRRRPPLRPILYFYLNERWRSERLTFLNIRWLTGWRIDLPFQSLEGFALVHVSAQGHFFGFVNLIVTENRLRKNEQFSSSTSFRSNNRSLHWY